MSNVFRAPLHDASCIRNDILYYVLHTYTSVHGPSVRLSVPCVRPVRQSIRQADAELAAEITAEIAAEIAAEAEAEAEAAARAAGSK